MYECINSGPVSLVNTVNNKNFSGICLYYFLTIKTMLSFTNQQSSFLPRHIGVIFARDAGNMTPALIMKNSYFPTTFKIVYRFPNNEIKKVGI